MADLNCEGWVGGDNCEGWENVSEPEFWIIPLTPITPLLSASYSPTKISGVFSEIPNGVIYFKVQRQNPPSDWVDLPDLSIEEFEDLTVEGNKAYRYRFAACNSAGCSAWSQNSFLILIAEDEENSEPSISEPSSEPSSSEPSDSDPSSGSVSEPSTPSCPDGDHIVVFLTYEEILACGYTTHHGPFDTEELAIEACSGDDCPPITSEIPLYLLTKRIWDLSGQVVPERWCIEKLSYTQGELTLNVITTEERFTTTPLYDIAQMPNLWGEVEESMDSVVKEPQWVVTEGEICSLTTDNKLYLGLPGESGAAKLCDIQGLSGRTLRGITFYNYHTVIGVTLDGYFYFVNIHTGTKVQLIAEVL